MVAEIHARRAEEILRAWDTCSPACSHSSPLQWKPSAIELIADPFGLWADLMEICCLRPLVVSRVPLCNSLRLSHLQDIVAAHTHHDALETNTLHASNIAVTAVATSDESSGGGCDGGGGGDAPDLLTALPSHLSHRIVGFLDTGLGDDEALMVCSSSALRAVCLFASDFLERLLRARPAVSQLVRLTFSQTRQQIVCYGGCGTRR